MKDLSWMSYIMLILASYRLTHLIVFDKITEFIRKPFMKKIEIQNSHGSKLKSIPKSLFGYLLNCYWCAGIWSATFLGGFYLWHPKYAIILIFILSIAGAQAIIETFVGVNIKKIDYYAKKEEDS